ncbi:MAG: DUF58 domain-containing protein [Gemmatimonadales bacterium]|nr:DUF58 domain-containing protein [Gemmatimonadales bacterium]
MRSGGRPDAHSEGDAGTAAPSAPRAGRLPGSRFLDPAALAALGDLRLAARVAVDGVLDGLHRSRLPGAGMEFAQYRSYQPGDDLRRVDWRMYARSDRLHVREAETERSFTVRLLLDASASMAHQEDGLSKFDYARFLVASLALLARRQGDAVALVVVAGGGVSRLPARHGDQQLSRVLHTLEGLEPRGRWPAEAADVFLPGSGEGGAGLDVLVSDLDEDADEIRAALRRASPRHERLVFELVGPRERALGWDAPRAFEDLETGAIIEADPAAVRATYLRARAARDAALEAALGSAEARHARVQVDQPLDGALRTYLALRDRAG